MPSGNGETAVPPPTPGQSGVSPGDREAPGCPGGHCNGRRRCTPNDRSGRDPRIGNNGPVSACVAAGKLSQTDRSICGEPICPPAKGQ